MSPSDDELRAFIARRLTDNSDAAVEATLRDYRADWVRQYQLAQRGQHLKQDGSIGEGQTESGREQLSR